MVIWQARSPNAGGSVKLTGKESVLAFGPWLGAVHANAVEGAGVEGQQSASEEAEQEPHPFEGAGRRNSDL